MNPSLQDKRNGGKGPSGIQCLKQNVRERRKPDTDLWELRLGKKRDMWPCKGQARPQRGPRVCSWAQRSAQGAQLLAQAGVQARAPATTAQAGWEGGGWVEGIQTGPPLPDSGSSPRRPGCSVLENGTCLGAFATPVL
ncbi:Hypothetical predicted protein [Marmota monax]|uniref:Uncharacterized protein n=1 Tax=Marmota monax TaxID=9995 RepID=A0A5E4AYK7_MARMO|nr:hypothetical protein GHT09_004485 [Marmota monax]VTJ62474.1 Hypothetical predicted protein [Marmota monax]